MYLLMTALVTFSGDAMAQDIQPPLGLKSGGCGTKPPPCLGIYTGDFSIVPPDWFAAVQAELDGQFNYFRIEVYNLGGGAFDVQANGVWLSEAYYSAAESGRRSQVYYVEAADEAGFTYVNLNREGASFELSVTGSVTEGLE